MRNVRKLAQQHHLKRHGAKAGQLTFSPAEDALLDLIDGMQNQIDELTAATRKPDE